MTERNPLFPLGNASLGTTSFGGTIQLPGLSGPRLVFSVPNQPAPAAPAPAQSAFVQFERGLTCAAMGAPRLAVQAMREATAQKPDLRAAWVTLAAQYRMLGDLAAAADARSRAAALPATEPAPAARAADPASGEHDLRARMQAAPRPPAFLQTHLVANPTDAAALRLLAELWRTERAPEAVEKLLERALQLAPGYSAARRDLLDLLLAQGKWIQALPHAERIAAENPADHATRLMRADVLTNVGETAAAIEIYDAIIAASPPHDADFWIAYGRALLDAGRAADAERAYRLCLDIKPGCGEAYWGIANLKFVTLSQDDIAIMRAQAARHDISQQDRAFLHYAIGFALEKQQSFDESFAHYAAGARLRTALAAGTKRQYNPDMTTAQVAQLKDFFTPALFAAAARAAPAAPTPIFIVGMPRAGSTLLEQILASHSLVEATQELPALGLVVRDIDQCRRMVTPSAYPACLATLDADELTEFGQRYLAYTAPFRKTDKPYFVDKLPGNWLHAGLIQLILPNAKIIDARRHPMASCLSTFKQCMVGGANYGFDLTHLARRTRDYMDLMAHFDAVLPGRIHRVQYETLVADTEADIARLLAYCGLPFEAACLRFWETSRVVRTPSAEQVRRPIFRDGVDQWRHYEAFLGAVKEVLG